MSHVVPTTTPQSAILLVQETLNNQAIELQEAKEQITKITDEKEKEHERANKVQSELNKVQSELNKVESELLDSEYRIEQLTRNANEIANNPSLLWRLFWRSLWCSLRWPRVEIPIVGVVGAGAGYVSWLRNRCVRSNLCRRVNDLESVGTGAVSVGVGEQCIIWWRWSVGWFRQWNEGWWGLLSRRV